LGAGDPRHPLHRERVEPRRCKGLDAIALASRIERSDQQRTFVRTRERFRFRTVHAQDYAGALEHVLARADRGVRFLEIEVGDGRSRARAFLDRHLGAEGRELLHSLRSRGAARLARRFLQDRDFHPWRLTNKP
jgi:hypothetical protein